MNSVDVKKCCRQFLNEIFKHANENDDKTTTAKIFKKYPEKLSIIGNFMYLCSYKQIQAWIYWITRFIWYWLNVCRYMYLLSTDKFTLNFFNIRARGLVPTIYMLHTSTRYHHIMSMFVLLSQPILCGWLTLYNWNCF